MNRRSIVIDTGAILLDTPIGSLPVAQKELTHMTVAAYVETRKLEISSTLWASHGRALARRSRLAGYQIMDVPDPRWGTVHAYDIELLDDYFENL